MSPRERKSQNRDQLHCLAHPSLFHTRWNRCWGPPPHPRDWHPWPSYAWGLGGGQHRGIHTSPYLLSPSPSPSPTTSTASPRDSIACDDVESPIKQMVLTLTHDLLTLSHIKDIIILARFLPALKNIHQKISTLQCILKNYRSHPARTPLDWFYVLPTGWLCRGVFVFWTSFEW